MQQKLRISLNNNNLCHDEAGRAGTVLNPNPVSTGLKLSCEEEERNSSVTSACENMKNNVPVMLSLGNTVKMEMNRQTEEFGRYIKLQEENILRGVREINQRHTVSMLTALEKGVNRKLHEKELQIENLNRKNKELGDKIKQVAVEAQSWHYRAKYNESVVNVLKNNIQQLMEQNTAHAREGSGDSEVDDAISCSNHPRNQGIESRWIKCRACSVKGVSVLLLPCRHLCLCTDCEGFIDVCPVCQVMKTASVHVYM
ncbi:probable boi-related E3 ubiquitin-protein ligase 3 [Phtheirospermum japonicum]|uniref:Probable boi-related E3 ubiquitin-protein ligase 3 n=1 Tax=Phtheirospermum japonicum TaxID=374723 RepID=A0A830BWD9_9LAMI|nr:probable boi-related E3 ubiquitin-protein ligase 3 [Phtheirospermum japonicum]